MGQRLHVPILVVFFALSAPHLAAQEVDDFLRCREVADSLERLRCYDDVAAGAATEETEYHRVDEADPSGASRFVPCPLRLEVGLPQMKIESDRGWTTGRLGAWECEDTRISSLNIRVERRPNRVVVHLKPWVLVRPSYDRLATLEFNLVNPHGAAHGARLGGLDAEEGQGVTETARIRLSPEDYEALFGDDDEARLRVVLRVQDNR